MQKEYTQTKEQVLEGLRTDRQGLSAQEAEKRLREHGENRLKEAEKLTLFQRFVQQLKDPMLLILLAAAAVSAVTNILSHESFTEVIIILLVVLLNAILGVVQESKAEAAIEALQTMTAATCKVLRDGQQVTMESRLLVPGDVVLLEAGDAVPADGRILESASMKIEEAALTGESVPVSKFTEPLAGEQVSLGDRKNMAYMGSAVVYGRGRMVVTATGMDTEMGKIAGVLAQTEQEETPLQRKLTQLGSTLSKMVLAICVFIFVFDLLVAGSLTLESVLETFMVAVSLAVAAIPEGLATVVTVVLSIGVTKMSQHNAVIRRLTAVETLGCTQVICSDKTGTLTQNKMTVEDYYIDGKRISASKIDITDLAQRRLLDDSILCNDSTNENGVEIGDPTETALINLGSRCGIEAADVRNLYPREGELPFDSDRKMMSTLHRIDGENRMIVKGAVDRLLELTERIWTKDGVREITEADKEKIQRQNQEFSMEGLRVLAFTFREIPEEHLLTAEDEDHLVFLGMIAMMDPPREESKAAVEECIKAGIRPVMITGDHKITAAAIAKRIGILKDLSEACEGAEIENMSDEELRGFVPKISVYARVSPEHKIRIVRAWQERGNIVSMTGDGVNDAPALKQADIGVAMGVTGTEVAKDAAAMVLTDDNFATIVKAVENGRNLYRNIKYAIQFLLSGNFGAILAVLYASIAGLPVPFAPVHLLFINLLTDSLPAIALGVEPHTSDVMNEKPRPADESILTKDFLSKIGLEGLVIGVMTMISFLTGYHQDGALLGSTYAFGTLCLARLFHGYNCKSDHPVIFTKRFFNNKWMQGAFALGAILITAVLTIPGLHQVFKVETLNFEQLGTVYLYAFACFPIIQLLKWVRGKLSE